MVREKGINDSPNALHNGSKDIADVCPPGLTCAACGQPLRGTVSRRTEMGFSHIQCPPARLRQCGVEGCLTNQNVQGMCSKHARSARIYGDPLATERRYLHIEDVRWLVETGETWEGSLRRLAVTSETLEKLIARHDRSLLTRFRRSEAS